MSCPILWITYDFCPLQLSDRFPLVRVSFGSSTEASVVCDFKILWLQKCFLCPRSQNSPLYWGCLQTPSWAKTYFEMLLVGPRPSTSWFWSTFSPSCPSQAWSSPVRKSRRPWLSWRMWAQTFRTEVRTVFCFTRRERMMLGVLSKIGFCASSEFQLGWWVLRKGVDCNK